MSDRSCVRLYITTGVFTSLLGRVFFVKKVVPLRYLITTHLPCTLIDINRHSLSPFYVICCLQRGYISSSGSEFSTRSMNDDCSLAVNLSLFWSTLTMEKRSTISDHESDQRRQTFMLRIIILSSL